MTTRRKLVQAAVAAVLPASLFCGPALAQAPESAAGHTPARPARVGWLMMRSTGLFAEVTARGFLKGLREAGYVEGVNLHLERRSADGVRARMNELARELVAANPDVLFTPGKAMTDAAWRASRRIPTVIAGVTDPIAVGYALSLRQPGKHITGVTAAHSELVSKRLQLLTELVPQAKRIGVLIDPDMLAECGEEMQSMEKAAAILGITLVQVPLLASGADVEARIKQAAGARVQALISAPMTGAYDLTGAVHAEAVKYQLPLMHDVPQLAHNSLAVYGPDFEDMFRRAGLVVARLLKGANPATTPIEEPREFRMVVNLKTAKAMGIKVPYTIFLRANEVIE